ncbi:MAG: hypothetical protein AB7L66_08020 [Gemmatimonadales bacterium]
MPADRQNRGPTQRESKSALLDAAREAVADRRSQPRPLPPGSRPAESRTAVRVLLGLVIAAGAGLLAVRPAWLAGPAPRAEAPEIRAASMTLSLVDAISRIKTYRDTAGQLPASAALAGVPDPGVVLTVTGPDSFEVSLGEGPGRQTLRSTDSLRTTVAQAIRTLQTRQ